VAWLDFVTSHKGKGREKRLAIDDWFEAIMSSTLAKVVGHFDSFRFRTALKTGFFDLQAHMRWYIRRCQGNPNRDLIDLAMRLQTQILSPVTPHLAEEAWEILGAEGLVCDSRLPEPVEPDGQARRAMAGEQLLISTLDDIREILRITNIDPKVVRLYTAPRWKRTVHRIATELHQRSELDMGTLMKAVMADAEVHPHSKVVPPFAQSLAEELPRTSQDVLQRISDLADEEEFLLENKGFLEKEAGCTIEVQRADDTDLVDPGNKARQAIPGRVAIYIE
jgi:leucyl-tRNA synthetase